MKYTKSGKLVSLGLTSGVYEMGINPKVPWHLPSCFELIYYVSSHFILHEGWSGRLVGFYIHMYI